MVIPAYAKMDILTMVKIKYVKLVTYHVKLVVNLPKQLIVYRAIQPTSEYLTPTCAFAWTGI